MVPSIAHNKKRKQELLQYDDPMDICDDAPTIGSSNSNSNSHSGHSFDVASLPPDCAFAIFAFVGGSLPPPAAKPIQRYASLKPKYFSCLEAGRYYSNLALVCRSWKDSMDAFLPSLIGCNHIHDELYYNHNLELTLTERLVEDDDGSNFEHLFWWLSRFRLKLASIRVPKLYRKQRVALSRILSSGVMVRNLCELSVGKSEWQEEEQTTNGMVDEVREDDSSSRGCSDNDDDISTNTEQPWQEWIHLRCPRLRRLRMVVDLGFTSSSSKPSCLKTMMPSLPWLESIEFLALTLVSSPPLPSAACYHHNTNADNDDGGATTAANDDADHANNHNPGLALCSTLVAGLPRLHHLELHGSPSLERVSRDARLPLVSSTLGMLHGYDFPNHIRINVDRCPHLCPFL